MENIFNNKAYITSEGDLLKIIKQIADGDIQAYCNLKNFFLYRFPLISTSTKDKYKLFAFDTMKQLADKEDNTFTKSFIGWMLWAGIGKVRNAELAKIYINNSAIQHNPIGLVELGLFHMLGRIDGKPDHYTALNLFEEAFQMKSNGYAALQLGILNEIDGKREQAITYLQNALSMDIPDAAVQLGNIYLMKGKFDDAHQLFSSTSNLSTSMFNLGFLFYGLAPDQVKADYVKAYQCFLIAQVLGHPFATFYITYYKNSISANLGKLCSDIEEKFDILINGYESSEFEQPKTAQDILNEMKKQFEELRKLNITKSMLNSTLSINDYVDYCYYHCILSSNLIRNLQVSIEDNNIQFIVEQLYNKEMLKLLSI